MYITNFSGMVNQKVFRDLTTKYGEIIFNRDTYIYICIFIHIIYIYVPWSKNWNMWSLLGGWWTCHWEGFIYIYIYRCIYICIYTPRIYIYMDIYIYIYTYIWHHFFNFPILSILTMAPGPGHHVAVFISGTCVPKEAMSLFTTCIAR